MTPVAPPPLAAPSLSAAPTLVYAARFYDPRPKVRTYSHLYKWRVGQTGRGTLLTTGPNDDTDPQAAPDGKAVYFIRHHDKKPPSVCAVSLQTKQVRVLFSGAAKAELEALHVSPSGQKVLVQQTTYGYKTNAHNYEQWFVVPAKGSQTKTAPHLLWQGGADEEASAAWAATDTQILLLHPPRYHWNDKKFEQKLVRGGGVDVVSIAAPNAPRSLPVEADDYTLETDLSPDRRLVLHQPYDANNHKAPFSSASLVRVADGQTTAKWPVAPNERLHWLRRASLSE